MSTTTAPTLPPAGHLLREWRQRRKRSQMDLALDAEVSTRHLSYVETGRASASREMLLRLAEHLDMPLRQRNLLLMAGGFAPHYPERPLQAPDMAAARSAVEAILKGHEPFPALAVDRHWHLLAANAALAPMMQGAAARLLEPPVNVLRLSLHPEGLAPRIENLPEWRAHLLERLRMQVERSGDAELAALQAELAAYPCPAGPQAVTGGIAVPLRIRVPGKARALSFLSTTTVFGTPVDITLAELALECFYPADDATRQALTMEARRP
ncbi:helix-turn-helix domain-containing protein [Pseudoroseomonas wenyumeiae]|uniref:Helix-turn-helix domain-containing protein n=1 Tax=Teichococcus wenyumeiae TaxID=2478470 RepID=A0A3A9JLC8_9PROT|nr:helix-turn-helix domain-containing protein [Pseudoroseomonas wenyumeiae]RKK05583.1 XRE family transcriptional regulator [Pseudoroseomonas wenyumeiae]RMI19969.1 helix-turn-helix domain-containing protein [Pseudoroseomonas wenyumeiae]